MDDAIGLVRDWLAHPHARLLQPTDAHLAALAIEHGATLASFDRDFDRFEGLDFARLRA